MASEGLMSANLSLLLYHRMKSFLTNLTMGNVREYLLDLLRGQ